MDKNLDSGMEMCSCTITVNSDKDADVVSFGCRKSDGSTYILTANLDTIKSLIYNYTAAGVTKMQTDAANKTDVRYAKGGLSPGDRHTTISIADTLYTFQITADASVFDRWLRSKMRKENYHE